MMPRCFHNMTSMPTYTYVKVCICFSSSFSSLNFQKKHFFQDTATCASCETLQSVSCSSIFSHRKIALLVAIGGVSKLFFFFFLSLSLLSQSPLPFLRVAPCNCDVLSTTTPPPLPPENVILAKLNCWDLLSPNLPFMSLQ